MDGFWSLIDGGERRELCRAGRIRVFPDAARLCVEGRRSETVMVLLDAHVRVSRRAGGGAKWLAWRGPGDIIGEMSLVLNTPHSATVATVRGGRVLVLSQEAFDAVARRHDGLQRALLRVTAERLRSADDERSAAEENVLPRVARLLSNPGAAPRFQHEIADLLGVSRASVVRALSRLRASGVVATRHGSIVVLDPAGLGRFAP
ncbi:Crp/Fnr family transcriptional regulator [Actinomadura sp. BRA 177]|uniref:Crp/Fnr family transcriptional regulator n=1 Tax=Actinomadura sp. BRA 177 TaxID=2745202 RepID=UPI0015954BB9|nr:Crp/Fnr family transcriptional regulator [Actinomadura sp. BRA 177]NVI93161.1 Crp/Fnr family transcriptional regulator [Actinomadura sp. BRA 177]